MFYKHFLFPLWMDPVKGPTCSQIVTVCRKPCPEAIGAISSNYRNDQYQVSCAYHQYFRVHRFLFAHGELLWWPCVHHRASFINNFLNQHLNQMANCKQTLSCYSYSEKLNSIEHLVAKILKKNSLVRNHKA